MKRATLLPVVLLAVASGGCSKDAATTHSTPSGQATPTGEEAGSADASASAAHSPDSGARAAAAPSNFSGTYHSEAATLYIPADWKGVRWSVADSPAGLGDGAIAIAIDPATGRVSGSVDGPLGPATVEGFAGDGGVSGNVSRKDPSDRGFAGTLVGGVEGDALTGTLNVSAADANAVRKATFTLSRSH
jgi:hypothetical protein